MDTIWTPKKILEMLFLFQKIFEKKSANYQSVFFEKYFWIQISLSNRCSCIGKNHGTDIF